MNIPNNPSITYIAAILFLIGLFLFVSGLNIIKIEKITISHGFKTWFIGLILMLCSIIVGVTDITNIILEKQSHYKQEADGSEKRNSLQKSPEEKVVLFDKIMTGDTLYTRGCSNEEPIAWINRFIAEKIDSENVVWGKHERAEIKDPNIEKLNYFLVEKEVNLTKICKRGGCYIREGNALIDVKKWLANGCHQ